MPTGLRQAAREFYEGIAATGVFRTRALGVLAGGATTSAAPAALGVTGSTGAAWTDSGLMATEAGGLRTTGGPFGKRSGCAA